MLICGIIVPFNNILFFFRIFMSMSKFALLHFFHGFVGHKIAGPFSCVTKTF